jgi:hypothetical protein
MSSCPSPEQLAELLTEEPAKSGGEALESHLGGCPACQGVLLGLAGPADFARRPTPLPGDEPRDSFLRGLKETLSLQVGVPIRAPRVSALGRAWKWAGHRPAVAGLMAALLFVITIGEAIVLRQWRVRMQDHQKAEAALEEAEGALYLCRLDLAESRLKANDAAGARAVLVQCAPAPGRPDRREARWNDLWQRCRAGLHGGD